MLHLRLTSIRPRVLDDLIAASTVHVLGRGRRAACRGSRSRLQIYRGEVRMATSTGCDRPRTATRSKRTAGYSDSIRG